MDDAINTEAENWRVTSRDWLAAVNRFESAGTPYALVTVTRSEPPASGKVGDKAAITTDGEFHGWIGGGCAQPVILKAVTDAFAAGEPMTVRITPTRGDSVTANGIREVPMACHSGGSLELFVEPCLPRTPLWVYGDTPVARTLIELARRVGFNATSATEGSEGACELRVIATQGRGDKDALKAALASGSASLWFVASSRKWEKVSAGLATDGIAADRLATVRAPAGIDIGAKTAEEIALSVLADVVRVHRCRKAELAELSGAA